MKYEDWKRRRLSAKSEHDALIDYVKRGWKLPGGSVAYLGRKTTSTPIPRFGIRCHMDIEEMSFADMERLLELRRALESWEKGELDELPEGDTKVE